MHLAFNNTAKSHCRLLCKLHVVKRSCITLERHRKLACCAVIRCIDSHAVILQLLLQLIFQQCRGHCTATTALQSELTPPRRRCLPPAVNTQNLSWSRQCLAEIGACAPDPDHQILQQIYAEGLVDNLFVWSGDLPTPIMSTQSLV